MTEQKQPVSLSSLLTPSKTVTVDYPGMSGFTVDLCYLAREELLKLRNRCLVQKFNRKTRAFDEQLDEEKFLVEYVKAVIKGWKGLKYSYLEELLLVDISSLDPEDELVFSQENAETLMKNAGDFDTWVTEVTGDLENFTKAK
jgi:predicted RNA-binding protein with EMAP domain